MRRVMLICCLLAGLVPLSCRPKQTISRTRDAATGPTLTLDFHEGGFKGVIGSVRGEVFDGIKSLTMTKPRSSITSARLDANAPYAVGFEGPPGFNVVFQAKTSEGATVECRTLGELVFGRPAPFECAGAGTGANPGERQIPPPGATQNVPAEGGQG
jgi:hypothetical protein